MILHALKGHSNLRSSQGPSLCGKQNAEGRILWDHGVTCKSCLFVIDSANKRNPRTHNYYKITKVGRGFRTHYYAIMPKGKKMRKRLWQTQLEQWGEGTSGGSNYGYRIYARPCKKPKQSVKRWYTLRFSAHCLENVK